VRPPNANSTTWACGVMMCAVWHCSKGSLFVHVKDNETKL
jgi:uncharacterized cupin superfamily protein